jgi:dihydrolipoamide dehydrogenase
VSEGKYDLIVIGAGPGGYTGAIRAAQLGMTVACIDKRGAPGGVCLNVGCIPSKALLQASEEYAHAGHDLEAMGVKVGKLEFDLKAMLGHKDKVVEANTAGVRYLLKKNKVDYLEGAAEIAAPGKVKVALNEGGERSLEADAIMIATGSESAPLPGVEIDEKQIVSSTGALALPQVPKHLVVVGGGYIGLEMGSVWRRLGAEVTVVEFLDRITPGMDGEVTKEFTRTLKKQGFAFKLGTKVTAAKTSKKGVALTLEPARGGDAETLEADVVLVAIGRRPYTEGLGLDALGVERDERGFIKVDGSFATSVEGIYAIGDCVPGPMLAHKADHDGIACVETLAGQAGHVDYGTVPGVVYTWPEVAYVGKTEEALKDEGVEYRSGKFPFTANGRARANNFTEGFVKVLADAKTDRVLGVHIIGPDAGTMIAEAVAVMEFGGAAEDIARICHPHPTLSEALKEAALAVDNRTINL